MKKIICCGILFSAVVSASAFALTPEEIQATHVMSGSEQPVAVQHTQDQVQSAPKTRAQVYQELVDAERSGEINQLNSTVYVH